MESHARQWNVQSTMSTYNALTHWNGHVHILIPHTQQNGHQVKPTSLVSTTREPVTLSLTDRSLASIALTPPGHETRWNAFLQVLATSSILRLAFAAGCSSYITGGVSVRHKPMLSTQSWGAFQFSTATKSSQESQRSADTKGQPTALLARHPRPACTDRRG